MDFTALDAKTVLKQSFLEEYNKGMNFFYSELVELNVNIHTINKIRYFPFKLFTAQNNRTFFPMVLKNFFQTSVLIITRIATDKKGDLYTLPQFKNKVLNNIIEKYKDEFSKVLKANRFDNEITNLLEKSTSLRNSRLAHITKQVVFDTKQIPNVKFKELENLRDALNKSLKVLTFNISPIMLPIEYYDKVECAIEMDSRSDIEKILDNIALNSNIMEISDCELLWKRKKLTMSSDEIEKLNLYRKKFHKCEV